MLGVGRAATLRAEAALLLPAEWCSSPTHQLKHTCLATILDAVVAVSSLPADPVCARVAEAVAGAVALAARAAQAAGPSTVRVCGSIDGSPQWFPAVNSHHTSGI